VRLSELNDDEALTGLNFWHLDFKMRVMYTVRKLYVKFVYVISFIKSDGTNRRAAMCWPLTC